MGQTAFVAVENEDSTYDIYYSDHGGREYLLRPLLRQLLDDSRLTMPREFPPLYPDLIADSLPPHTRPDELGDEPLVLREPIAVSVPRKTLLSNIPGYDTEVLYVVSNDEIDVLVPVVLDARALYTLFTSARLELYSPERDRHDTLQAMASGGAADVTFDGEPVRPAELRSLPSWAETTLQQAHRYLLYKCHQIRQYDDLSEMKLFLGSGAATVSHLEPDTKIPFTPALPIRVPWDNGGPKYPMYGGQEGAIGALPKVHASRLRYQYYFEIYEVLETVESANRSVAVRGPNVAPMAQLLNERFGDDFAWRYMSDGLSETIRGELA